jgi:hypothetical protein
MQIAGNIVGGPTKILHNSFVMISADALSLLCMEYNEHVHNPERLQRPSTTYMTSKYLCMSVYLFFLQNIQFTLIS